MALSIHAWTFAIVMGAASGHGDEGPMHVLLAGRARSVVVAAIAGALQRLDAPSCQRVLTDFADERGRSLADSLLATGLPLRIYASRLYAVEGDNERACANEPVLAFTAPGSHVIHVCSVHFEAISGGMLSAQMTIIHELLHTLGLGENLHRAPISHGR